MSTVSDGHAASIRSLVSVALAIWISACNSPSSPGSRTFTLSGLVRDSSSFGPVADATIQVTSGSLAGRVTTSDTSGRFQFAEAASVADPTTLLVLKAGYFPVTVQVERTDVVITLASSRIPLEGNYTMTFTAADDCSMLPSPLRRRTYSDHLRPQKTCFVVTGWQFRDRAERIRLLSGVAHVVAIDSRQHRQFLHKQFRGGAAMAGRPAALRTPPRDRVFLAPRESDGSPVRHRYGILHKL